MSVSTRKITSFLAVSALIFASLFTICIQATSSCGSHSVHSLVAERAGDAFNMDACLASSSACSNGTLIHMTTFASLYPSMLMETASLLLLLVSAFFLARFPLFKQELRVNEAVWLRLKRLRQRFSVSILPLFLLFAFRRGILHSKIYARA